MTDHQLIRAATPKDWAAIWPFFQEIVLSQETYAYSPDLTSQEAEELWLESPPGHTVVLEEADAVIGSAKMGPNRPGPGAHIGTASFMVDARARGHGVGHRLAEYVVAWHREQGFRGIQFNAVVETNTTAVKLWQHYGFEILGTVPHAFRSPTHGDVGLHLMFLDLGQ